MSLKSHDCNNSFSMATYEEFKFYIFVSRQIL